MVIAFGREGSENPISSGRLIVSESTDGGAALTSNLHLILASKVKSKDQQNQIFLTSPMEATVPPEKEVLTIISKEGEDRVGFLVFLVNCNLTFSLDLMILIHSFIYQVLLFISMLN